MTPERKQAIEDALYGYYTDQGRFRALTRVEYDWEDSLTEGLPQDSVASARIDGMPHGQVAMTSDPTLRVVLSRERIEEARTRAMEAQLESVRADIDRLTERLGRVWDLWVVLDPVERRLIEWRYFPSAADTHPPSLEDLAQRFREAERKLRAETSAWIPVNRQGVAERLQMLLEHIDAIWPD